MTIKESIMSYINEFSGSTDSDIERYLKQTRPNISHQTINQACRGLEAQGLLVRRVNSEKGNLIGNYPSGKAPEIKTENTRKEATAELGQPLQEEDIKHILNDMLINDGWNVKTAWGHQQGIDIEATKENQRWIIEVKGPGSRQPMRVNYFISILGETLQRMNDENARYSIALPDLKQYRGLWERLPKLAKDRTTIDLILVDEQGKIEILK